MSSTLHAAQFAAALEALEFFTGWAGGWRPLERRREDRTRLNWLPAVSGRLPATIEDLDARYSDELAFGLPRRERFHEGIGQATVLWCRVEGDDQVKRAQRFKPYPTIVLREGSSSRRLLLWALEHPATYFEVEAANRKLAYAFRAVQKHGSPDALMIPCPGTCLRLGRSRPVPVRVARLTLDTFDLSRVVGKLREPPARDDWRTVAPRHAKS